MGAVFGHRDAWEWRNHDIGINAGATGNVYVANAPVVLTPQFSAPVIPVTSAGGVYAIRGVRQYWTPTLIGSTANGTGTYSTQAGTFWYDGSQITMTFNIQVNTLAGQTGNWQISGVPFALNANAGQDMTCTVALFAGVTLTAAYTGISALISATASPGVIQLIKWANGQPSISIPHGDFGAAVGLTGTCVSAAGQ